MTAYRSLSSENKYSRRLLLFYSVECGLKYLLMDRWGILSVSEIESDKEKEGLLGTHNLREILKALGQQGMVSFSSFKTCHGDFVNIAEYHQFYRYGIRPDDKALEKEEKFEDELKQVADWINEVI